MWPFLGRNALAEARTGCIRRALTSPINASSPRLRTRPASEVICQNRAHPASPPRNLAAPESSIVWPPLCCWRAAVAQRACNALPTCTAAARAACGDCEARDLGRELRPRDHMQRTWRLSVPLPANGCRPPPLRAPPRPCAHGRPPASQPSADNDARATAVPSMIWVAGPGPGPGPGPRLPLRQVRQRQAR